MTRNTTPAPESGQTCRQAPTPPSTPQRRAEHRYRRVDEHEVACQVCGHEPWHTPGPCLSI